MAPQLRAYLVRLSAWICAFLALDWATFASSLAPLGITPWNPAVGLGVAAVITGGVGLAPLLFLGPMLSETLVRGMPFAWWVTAMEAAISGVVYLTGLVYLLRPSTGFDRGLHRLRDLLLLAGIGAASALVVSAAFEAMLFLSGQIDGARLAEAVLRYWVSDVIGLTVIAPFVLVHLSMRSLPRFDIEAVLQAAVILLVVMIVVGPDGPPRTQLSFLLLVPIFWVAVRSGFQGTTAALLLMQVSIMLALHVVHNDPPDIELIQTVLLVLSVTGLAIGLLVSERAADERRLRMQQDAMARAARLGSMGEFAAAMAHELNQPLTAAGNYARAVVASLAASQPRTQDARLAAGKLVEQVDRSAQVIRRLRELIRVGRIEVATARVERILQESLDLLRPSLLHIPVPIDVNVQAGLPTVGVDVLQIEQVIINLVRNAVEALAEAGTLKPQVLVTARRADALHVEIAVIDNGPGFPPGFDQTLPQALASSKPDGLGVGLALCRTIVQAHGGTFVIEEREGGAVVRFTVPIAAPLTVTETHVRTDS
jgi:signal transduction histidine kinase